MGICVSRNSLNSKSLKLLPKNVSGKKNVSANDISREIRLLMTKFYGKYLSPDGKFEYKKMASDAEYRSLGDLICELADVNLETLSQNELLCFGINIYNTLVIHAIIEAGGMPKNKISKLRFFEKYGYNVGGKFYSLNDIENGILRGNKVGPASYWPPFNRKDDRAKIIMNPIDPRVHFALNCGALSCPPIRVYNPETIDSQLSLATKSFLSQTLQVKNNSIEISKLFSWYRTDFGTDNELLRFLRDHVTQEVQDQIDKLSGDVKFTFGPYDWTSNAK